ncbi:MAG: YaaA family protein [Rikenellaceae bacterium]
MIALISPAKTMRQVSTAASAIFSEPRFGDSTAQIVGCMLRYSATELVEIFKVSAPIARELRSRFLAMMDDEVVPLPAVESYDGVVYKHFKGDGDFVLPEQEYLQAHVRISSLLYGLLRPMDCIKPYRMEGFVRLADSDCRVDKFWRDRQTQLLIDDVRQQGGELVYLASREEQNAFNWREVLRSVRVIDIEFLQYKGDKLRQVVIYTKMARGEMIRFMIDRRVTNPEELKEFEWSGYRYDEARSTADKWVWVMG